MSLRLRLVAALVVLLALGLAVFGYATYTVYKRAQYAEIDDQLRAATPILERILRTNDGGRFDVDDDTPPPGGPPRAIAPGTYAELRLADGTVVNPSQLPGSDDQPAIPEDAPTDGDVITVGSVDGDTTWRLLASPGFDGATMIIAAPTTDVEASLRRLVLIETAAGLVLLALLAGGAWVILRRGLKPLETMAGAAERISGGDLTQRVEPADGRDEVGQLGLALNTMLDDIEDAFRQRDATEQRLRQFLSDASHELRTPLTSIQGFAELFRLGTDDPTLDLPVVMRRIEQESARMRLLVDDLLLLARLDETHATQREPVDLAVLAADACTDATVTDASRAITLDAPEPVVVAGDSSHLRQAIANLVTNALRHTPAGSPIEVRVRRDGASASVTVEDHGAGLDEDALDHVFDRFWQADAARSTSGVGLGLAIVAGIAAEHGGRATVTNRDGGGAAFTLTLPIGDPVPAPAG